MQKRFILALMSASLMVLSACETNVNASLSPNPGASASPAADPSAAPSADPSAGASANVNAGVNLPGVAVGGNASGSSTLNPNAALEENGALTVTGSDIFNKYDLQFSKGMKWVYGMKLDLGAVSTPSLPSGISIPGMPGGSGGSSTDLGTFSMEVIDVQGDLVTFRTEVNNTMAGAPEVPPSEKTVKMESASKMYVEAFQAAGSGTLAWSSTGNSESISVPAGSYTADVITGKASIVLETATGGAMDQDIKLWMDGTIGMVKEEVVTKTMSNGVSVDSTTVIELQSFTK